MLSITWDAFDYLGCFRLLGMLSIFYGKKYSGDIVDLKIFSISYIILITPNYFTSRGYAKT